MYVTKVVDVCAFSEVSLKRLIRMQHLNLLIAKHNKKIYQFNHQIDMNIFM